MRDSTSDLLAANCDEFIYYEDIGAAAGAPTLGETCREKKRPAFKLLFETIEALQRENVGVMHSSLVKDTMKRKQPQFSEVATATAPSRSCSRTRRSSASSTLRKDPRSGTYVVEGFHG